MKFDIKNERVVHRLLSIILSNVRLGYIRYWVAPFGYDISGIGPAGLEPTTGIRHR